MFQSQIIARVVWICNESSLAPSTCLCMNIPFLEQCLEFNLALPELLLLGMLAGAVIFQSHTRPCGRSNLLARFFELCIGVNISFCVSSTVRRNLLCSSFVAWG
jgi:hypothetical protein